MHALTESLQPILQAHSQLIPALRQLSHSVQNEAYLVGGCIRDTLLNRPVKDIDLTIDGDGIQHALELAKAIRSRFIPLDEKDRTGRVVIKRKWTIDITSLKGKTLYQDLNRRDFTINAMAARLSDTLNQNPTLIDPLNGARDLHNKALKAISEQAFIDDPLRLLRAFRFSAQLDLAINEDTGQWITRWTHRLPAMSAERILEELSIFLSQGKTAKWMSAMYEMGIVQVLFPGWFTQKDIDAPGYTLLEQIDHILEQPDCSSDNRTKNKLAFRKNQVMAGRRLWPWVLRLAAVILEQHQVQRPDYEPFLRTAYDRLSLSKKEQKALRRLVGLTGQLLEFHHKETLTDDHLFNIACEGDEDIIGVVILIEAMQQIHRSSIPAHILNRLLWIQDRRKIVQQKALLVTGTDILQTHQLKPGPQIGRLLEQLEKSQILGTIHTRTEALHAIQGWLSSPVDE
jgi:tRNA nucleotidyltransferase/poly(A) polymerase